MFSMLMHLLEKIEIIINEYVLFLTKLKYAYFYPCHVNVLKDELCSYLVMSAV
jgi:hypothetical protein